MITSNVFQRTFFIKYGESTGTAFVVDVEGRQYLVTARHVVGGIEDDGGIEVFHENEWKVVGTRIVVRVKRVELTLISMIHRKLSGSQSAGRTVG